MKNSIIFIRKKFFSPFCLLILLSIASCHSTSKQHQHTARQKHLREAGLSPDSLQKVNKIMQKAIADSTFPGGVVGIVKNDSLAFSRAYGYRTYAKKTKVSRGTVYDLASLTKIVATTPSVMKLMDEGKLHLNEHLYKFFPEFASGEKRKITVRELLLHTSGLPAYRIYVDSLKTRKQILQAVKNEPLINKPGKKFVYSDLGFILLGRIVQKVSHLRLDTFTEKYFYQPLGMRSTHFNPDSIAQKYLSRIAPTEKDTTFRHKLLGGEVDDPRAWYLGGVAGHAGLFSNVHDLAIFAQMLLNKGTYAGKRYLSATVIKKFTRNQSKLKNRGYGFDRKSPQHSTAGKLMSDQSFGHLGFTGTSIWIDPERKIAIILLTNRVYPHRSYGKNINAVRANVADAVMSSIIQK